MPLACYADAMTTEVHPYQRIATRQLKLGIGFVALGSVAILGSPYAVFGGACLFVGVVFAYFGAYFRAHSGTVLLNSKVSDLVARGRVVEASALLDAVPPRKGSLGRALELQRASIAFSAGDAAKTEALATRALAIPRSLMTLEADVSLEALGRSVRALARASMGKEAEAMDDVRAVVTAPDASPRVLANAALAEAILLARKEDHEALARALRESAPLVDHMAPRERALVRALRRMLAARAGSAYRAPAPREERGLGEPGIGEWVARLVPRAAAFVTETGGSEPADGAALAPAPPAVVTAEAGSTSIARRAKPTRGALAARMTSLWMVVAIVLFGTVWLSKGGGGGGGADGGMRSLARMTEVGAVMLVGLVAGSVVVGRVRAQRGRRAILSATRKSLRGDERGCVDELTALTRHGQAAIAATAYLNLAGVAQRRRDFAQALSQAEAGLERISRSPAYRALHSDLLVPQLVAERAFALAVLGRDAEAAEEIATLEREHPTFAFMARAVLGVRLVRAMRREDFDEAARLARARTSELALSRREEMLADVAQAIAGGVSEDENARIASELAEDADLAAWIDAIAPGARGRLPSRGRARVEAEVEGRSPTRLRASRVPERSGGEADDRRQDPLERGVRSVAEAAVRR